MCEDFARKSRAVSHFLHSKSFRCAFRIEERETDVRFWTQSCSESETVPLLFTEIELSMDLQRICMLQIFAKTRSSKVKVGKSCVSVERIWIVHFLYFAFEFYYRLLYTISISVLIQWNIRIKWNWSRLINTFNTSRLSLPFPQVSHDPIYHRPLFDPSTCLSCIFFFSNPTYIQHIPLEKFCADKTLLSHMAR